MLRLLNSLLATLAFALFLLAAALGRADEAPDHAALDHVYVRITDAGLRPASQRMRADQAIGFLNSSSQVAFVSFDADVASRLACRSRASFALEGGRLRSGRIQGSQYASLCRLKPGEYAYRVELAPGAGSGGESVTRSFEGRLVVE